MTKLKILSNRWSKNEVYLLTGYVVEGKSWQKIANIINSENLSKFRTVKRTKEAVRNKYKRIKRKQNESNIKR